MAYNSLLIERRKLLHERAGQALESMFAGQLEDHLDELAHHYDRAGNVGKGAEYLRRAGTRAAEQAAYSEAIEYLTRALKLLRQLPDNVDRARHELELQMALSASLHVARGAGAPDRERALTRARELCEQLGNRTRLIEVLLGLSALLTSRGELSAAHKLAQRAIALAELARELRMLGAAHAVMGLILFGWGQFTAAREHYESSVELFGPGPIGTTGQVALAGQTNETLLSYLLGILGYPEMALTGCHGALDMARRRSDPYVVAIALTVLAGIRLELRDTVAVESLTEQLFSITSEHGIPIYRAFATFYRGWIMAADGETKEGIDQMRRVLSESGSLPIMRPNMIVAFAQVCGRSGLAEEGLTIVEESLTQPQRNAQAELHRLKGELMLIKDPRSEDHAERSFREAIGIASEQAARLYELRATTSLARLLATQGRRDEARKLLADIYHWFTEGFDTADLKDAKSLLEELGGTSE